MRGFLGSRTRQRLYLDAKTDVVRATRCLYARGWAINKTGGIRLLSLEQIPQTSQSTKSPDNRPAPPVLRTQQDERGSLQRVSNTATSYQLDIAVGLICEVAFWLRLWLPDYDVNNSSLLLWPNSSVRYWSHYNGVGIRPVNESFLPLHIKILSMASQFGPNTPHETRDT